MDLSSAQKHLTAIRDWPERALQASYRVDELARICGENPQALRVFFVRTFKVTTKKQLREQRISQVKRRLKEKEPLKNIRVALGYSDSPHLTHDFKAVCGMSPREWMKLID